MKQKLLLKSMLLLFALIAGSSSAWADDVTVTFNPSTDVGTGTGASGNNSVSKDGITISCTAGGFAISSGAHYRFAKNSTTTITSTLGNIKSIVINGPSGTEDYSMSKFGDNTGWTLDSDAGTYSWSGDAASVSVVAKGAQVRPTSIAVTYTSSGVEKVLTPSISGTEAFLNSTEVTITCETTGATIQYSTNDGVSWNTYTAPITLSATTTVKAKATKSGLTDSDEVSKKFTKVTSMTVADALTAIDALDNNGTIDGQCVAGIISQIDSYSSNAITYWISDDGTKTSQLEIFKGKGLNGAAFSAKTDLNVGDKVVVYGQLKKYVTADKTTPEFTQNSMLLSYEATGIPAPYINANNVKIESFETSGVIAYTIDNPTEATLTAAIKEGDWISNVNVTDGKITFSATENDGEQRTATITLSYEGASNNNKVVSITQNASFGTASLPFAFDGGKADIANTDGLTHTGLGSDYSSSPKLKFDGAGDYVILKIAAGAEYLSYDIKGNPSGSDPWSGTFKVQTSADGITFTDARTYNSFDSFVLHQSLALSSSVRFVKWIFTEKGAGNVAVGKIGVNCEVAAVSDAGYITYNTPTAIDFEGTEGVTAYVVSAIGASSVTLEEITAAPAYTPVILRASEGILQLKLAAGAANVGTNLLQASRGANKAGEAPAYDYYALGKKDDVVGFCKVKDGVTIPAGKCFLIIAKSSAPEFLSFDGETTGINMVHGSEFKVNGEIYNLNGQRVAQPTKGLYIVNGKKVMFK